MTWHVDTTVPTFVFFEWARLDAVWIYLRQRPQHLAKGLIDEGCQVLFVEPPLPGGASALQPVPFESGTFRIIPWSDDPSVHASCLQQLNAMLPNATWLVHYPGWMPLLREHLLPTRTLVYDCMDDWPEFPGTDSRVFHWEVELASKADLVLASSLSLFTRMKLLNPATIYVSNAVDQQGFARRLPEPDDLRHIPSPRLLFVGFLGEWVDFNLIRFVARARPQWSVVMIGPSDVSASRLPNESNIFWLGKRPYVELPAYMSHCDVGLIPFKQTRLTRAVNPLKAHEYLACGLPIVSTFLPDLLLFNDPAVNVTTTYDEFLNALDYVLRENPKPQGPAGAQSGTWEQKVKCLLARLRGLPCYDDHAPLERYIKVLREMTSRAAAPDLAEDLALAQYVSGRFEDVLECAPGASTLRAAALARLGRHVEARRAVREHLEHTGKEVESFLDSLPDDALTAYVLYINREPWAALEHLSGLATLQPIHYLLLARCYAELGELPEAVAAYAEVVARHPHLMQAQDFLAAGKALDYLGLDQHAEQCYLYAFARGRKEDAEKHLANLYLTRALRAARRAERE